MDLARYEPAEVLCLDAVASTMVYAPAFPEALFLVAPLSISAMNYPCLARASEPGPGTATGWFASPRPTVWGH